MTEMMETKFLGCDLQIPQPEDPEDAVIPDYGNYLYYVKQAEEDFVKKMREFFNHTLKDKTIEKSAREWEKAGAILAGYATTMFNVCKDNDELRKYALDMLDKVTKSAGARVMNLTKRRERVMAENPDDKDEEARLTKVKQDADAGLIRAINTQNRYKDLYEKGESLETSRQQEEAELSAEAEELRKMIPAGHLHIPGRIYPPIPIPAGKRVPYAPKPYQLYREQPVEAYTFDTELDEFVIKPGYVSADGLIDDQSVIRDRANHRVIMKFRGGEPIIWEEWKATWAGDIPDEDSWMWEYYGRLGYQMREDQEMRIFERRPYEDS